MWKIVGTVAGVVIAGWLGWVSLTAMGATPQETFDLHVQRATDKYDAAQQRIEDKIDKIQETILDLHKE